MKQRKFRREVLMCWALGDSPLNIARCVKRGWMRWVSLTERVQCPRRIR